MKISRAWYKDDMHFLRGLLVERLFRKPPFIPFNTDCGWSYEYIDKKDLKKKVPFIDRVK